MKKRVDDCYFWLKDFSTSHLLLPCGWVLSVSLQETTQGDAVMEADVNPKAYLLQDTLLIKKLLDLA